MGICGSKNMRLFKKYLIVVVAITMISTASGLPEILDGFNKIYGTSKSKLDSCELCHIKDKPNEKSCGFCHKSYIPGKEKPQKSRGQNEFGKEIQKRLNKDRDSAFKEIEVLDSDNDGMSNIDEIRGKAFPGNSLDKPIKKEK